ncbi:MAG: hypothetical protein R3C27_02230 [Hyphomonadaceae bacterium]
MKCGVLGFLELPVRDEDRHQRLQQRHFLIAGEGAGAGGEEGDEFVLVEPRAGERFFDFNAFEGLTSDVAHSEGDSALLLSLTTIELGNVHEGAESVTSEITAGGGFGLLGLQASNESAKCDPKRDRGDDNEERNNEARGARFLRLRRRPTWVEHKGHASRLV